MIQAIIFDCFGVVISDALTVMCHERLRNRPADVHKIWRLIEQTNKGLMTSNESSTEIGKIFGLSISEYRSQLSQGEQKDQQLLNYISELRNDFNTAMLSNVGVGSLARRFDPGELEHYFDVIVASGEIGFAKPEARAYEIVAERLGLRCDECLFTDDRLIYIEGAQAIGMHTIQYQSLPQFKAELKLKLANSK